MRLASLVLSCVLLACSGKVVDSSADAGTPPKTGASGLAEDRTLASLDEADERKLCDWIAASLGGYGAKKTCGGDVSMGAPESAAECISSMPKCDVTVATVEACVSAWVASDACSLDFTHDPACQALERCDDGGDAEPVVDPPPPPDDGAFSPAPDELP